MTPKSTKLNELIFATGNQNKVFEVNAFLQNKFNIKSLKDISFFDEIPETSDTIEGNAIQKATYVYQNLGHNCFAEDTGLEVEALNGEPGVFSARYAGPERDANANMDKILNQLLNHNNRKARFKTIIALIENGTVHCFEGIINGNINTVKKGNAGFGYDPIFIPENYEISFAQMETNLKAKISHRGKAMKKFVDFLTARI